jgi:hypothetical protein
MSVPYWSTTTRGFEGPDYAPNRHDTVRLKGMYLPGICKIKALPTREYDREKAPGRDGATIIMQGYLPGPIDIEVLLWMPIHFELWEGIVDKLWGAPGKLAPGAAKKQTAASIEDAAKLAEERAIEISHPATDVMKIHRVVITGISLPEPGPQPQSRVVNIKCLEFVPSPTAQQTAVVKGTDSALPETSALYQHTPKNAGGTGAGPSPGLTDGGPHGPPRSRNRGSI